MTARRTSTVGQRNGVAFLIRYGRSAVSLLNVRFLVSGVVNDLPSELVRRLRADEGVVDCSIASGVLPVPNTQRDAAFVVHVDAYAGRQEVSRATPLLLRRAANAYSHYRIALLIRCRATRDSVLLTLLLRVLCPLRHLEDDGVRVVRGFRSL